jgi:hypothetical protein
MDDPEDPLMTYEFTVDGHLDDHWSAWLGDVTLTRLNDGTTTFTMPVVDQAQLYGVLAGLRDMGATLLSVRVVTQVRVTERR